MSEAAKRADHEQGGMGHNRAYSKERLRPYSEVGKGRDIVKDSLQLCEYTVCTVRNRSSALKVKKWRISCLHEDIKCYRSADQYFFIPAHKRRRRKTSKKAKLKKELKAKDSEKETLMLRRIKGCIRLAKFNIS